MEYIVQLIMEKIGKKRKIPFTREIIWPKMEIHFHFLKMKICKRLIKLMGPAFSKIGLFFAPLFAALIIRARESTAIYLPGKAAETRI
jgi:hypothetical protein